MEQYQVTGMSCAACQARVEKAVSKVPGVTSCAVSLLTNSMGVEGDASAADIIKAVENAGYGASLREGGKKAGSAGVGAGAGAGVGIGASAGVGAGASGKGGLYRAQEEMLADHETPALKKRLITSIAFLLILMYFSMGHMMWGWPLPSFFDGNHIAMGIVQMLLAGIVMVINQKFFISGFKGLIHGGPNMDTLVALGSLASFGWSTYALLAMTGAQVRGDEEAVMGYMMELYFESAAMILTLITVGKMLEARSKGKTTDAIKGLMKLAPRTATVVREGVEMEIPTEDILVGDVFLVKPGENIPVDGVVLEGTSAIDEAALTGESIPVDVTPGSRVSAATTNLTGFIKAEAKRVGEDTTLSQIIRMVTDAAATKAPIAKIADKVSGVFVPIVIGIALVTALIWLIVGREPGFALARGISVLVISCPCALGLATPVAIMVGNGVGAKNGILYKTAVSLEETGKAEIAVLDKTGTITKGEPRVTDVVAAFDVDEGKLIRLAASLEKKSEYPLAKAVMMLAEERGIEAREVEEFQALPGNGLKGRLKNASDEEGDSELYGGNLSFIETKANVGEELTKAANGFSQEGKTCLFFAEGEKVLGLIAVADVIKEDSPEAIKELQNMGLKVVMLTGDNEKTAKAIGDRAGVDKVIAGVLPDGKEKVVRELQEKGKVIMVGDGVNDAPALTRADIGMAIGAGADIAVDAADIVLVNSKLSDVPAAIRLSRATLRNIHQNLFWAFFYNAIGIPLAAGVFIKAFGWSLNPMFGAAAMSLSSFFVVTNALRLNLFNIYDTSKDRRGSKHLSADLEDKVAEGSELEENGSKKNELKDNKDEIEDVEKQKANNNNTEVKQMKKTMTIEGMMCAHCEATVKKALEALEGVESAEVSHEKGTAIVTCEDVVTDEALKTAVEEKDYEVKEIA